MAKWSIEFHAKEYAELHLRPDVWTIECDHDTESTRFVVDKLAKRLGASPARIELSNPNGDESDVYLFDTAFNARACTDLETDVHALNVGYVAFFDEEN